MSVFWKLQSACWCAEGEAEEVEEEVVPAGQEGPALFMGETAFMQGAVGLTLMPSHASHAIHLSDLAQMACLVLGSDKLVGCFLTVSLPALLTDPVMWPAALMSCDCHGLLAPFHVTVNGLLASCHDTVSGLIKPCLVPAASHQASFDIPATKLHDPTMCLQSAVSVPSLVLICTQVVIFV